MSDTRIPDEIVERFWDVFCKSASPSPKESMRAALAAVLPDLVRGERESAQDKIDGLEGDLDSALDVLWRRGDDEAREWIRMNYLSKVPALERIAAIRVRG